MNNKHRTKVRCPKAKPWSCSMTDALRQVLKLIKDNDGINDKARLTRIVSDAFQLVKDRSAYYCADYALRFSSSAGRNFGNTVLSLSNLRKYDDRPFIVCLVTPLQNHCFIANTTFLKKISHSSQELRENNIRGSFNGCVSLYLPIRRWTAERLGRIANWKVQTYTPVKPLV